MGAPRAAEDPAAIQMGAEQKRLESGTADPSDADPGATGPGKPEPDNRAIPTWAYWLGIIFGIGTLLFLYRHLGAVADGRSGEPLRTLVQEYVAACGAGLLFFPLRALVRRWPPRWQRLPLYALVFLGFSFIHTTWNWGVRNLVYLAFGWGAYDYGRMPVRYLMELPIDVLSLTLMAVGILGWDGLQRARARELRSAQLESRLARAQVHNLRLQLQPHFLFNALNTISATLYRDAEAADEMIDRLAALLRTSLRTTDADVVSLAAELELLEGYLSIMRARFGDRLRVELEVSPVLEELGLHQVKVPSLLLQPLVENSVRHGSAEKVGRGRVWVRLTPSPPPAGSRDGDYVELVVEDDGPGMGAGRDPLQGGLGLSTTAERLQLLYGADHEFSAGNREAGGFRVRAVLPWGGTAGPGRSPVEPRW